MATLHLDDFVKTDDGVIIGFVTGYGEMKYGKKWLPMVSISDAHDKNHQTTLESVYIINSDGFPVGEMATEVDRELEKTNIKALAAKTTPISKLRIKNIVTKAISNSVKVTEDEQNSIDALNNKWHKLESEEIGFESHLDDIMSDYYSKELEKQDLDYKSLLEEATKKLDEAGAALAKVAGYVYDLNNLWNDMA